MARFFSGVERGWHQVSQGEDIAVAQWLSWGQEGCGRIQGEAPSSLCGLKKDGEQGSLHGHGLCSEVAGEVIARGGTAGVGPGT